MICRVCKTAMVKIVSFGISPLKYHRHRCVSVMLTNPTESVGMRLTCAQLWYYLSIQDFGLCVENTPREQKVVKKKNSASIQYN